MQSPVKLYLRVRFPDGSHPFLKAAFASNGRVRPGYAMHAGKAISFPSCSYYCATNQTVSGQPCSRCGQPVQRIRYADNETNYCAQCQTEGKVLADRSLSRLLGKDRPRTLDELEALKRK